MRPRRILVAAGAVLAVGAAALGVWRSSWLKLETVQVTGNHHATTEQVQAAAALVPGMRLTAVSSARVAARVGALPWVAEATVTHILPSRVRISIRERTPAALVQAGPRTYLVDRSGVVQIPGLNIRFDPDRLAIERLTISEGQLLLADAAGQRVDQEVQVEGHLVAELDLDGLVAGRRALQLPVDHERRPVLRWRAGP